MKEIIDKKAFFMDCNQTGPMMAVNDAKLKETSRSLDLIPKIESDVLGLKTGKIKRRKSPEWREQIFICLNL